MVFLASASTLPGLVVRTESGGDGSPKSYCLVATAFGQRLLSATRALVVVAILWYSTGNIHGWKILPARMGSYSNTKWVYCYWCEENNADAQCVQPNYC